VELSLEVQGGHDYFRFVEGTCIIACVLSEGEKNHKKGGLNCVFGNFFFYVLDNCPQVQSLK